MTRLTRRHLCEVFGTSLAIGSAGCVSPRESSRYKILAIQRTDAEDLDSGWQLTVTVDVGVNGFEGRAADFHDVVLLGYAADGSLACRRQIGDIETDGGRNLVTVELTCSRLPDVLTFRAEESPCDEDTVINVYEYQGTPQDIGHYWSETSPRECNEGLPPDV